MTSIFPYIPRMAYLLFHRSPKWQDYYSLDQDEIIVGREEGCDIVLLESGVSRRHARLFRRNGRWSVEDLKTKNGTMLDDKPIATARLSHGQIVKFGDVPAKFLEQSGDGLEFFEDVVQESFAVERDALVENATRLRLLYDLAEIAYEPEDEARLAQRVLQIVGEELECENAYLGLTEPDSSILTRGYFHARGDQVVPFLLSRTILNKVLHTRQSLRIFDASQDCDLNKQRSVAEGRVRSVLCAPLLASGQAVGVLYADTRSGVRIYGKEDLVFLGALGCLLGALFRTANTMQDLRRRNRELRRRLESSQLIGKSLSMVQVREKIRKFASRGDAPVLLLGESGTGKELAARLIHLQSSRAEKPFLDINCAAIPKDLFESELFGHTRGAFTSATGEKHGLFTMADGGVLFLDEIGEMPLELQSKLLRVLETKSYRPVGAHKPLQADVRIVTATNRDLQALTADGRFRQDLFFRLNVLPIMLPPLRERVDDIPELCEYFLSLLRGEVTTKTSGFSAAAIALLAGYSWPGNVRELKSVIQRALYICEDEVIEAEHLHGFLSLDSAEEGEDDKPDEPPPTPGSLEKEIAQLERARICDALERHHWNRSQAAAELGITRKTLRAKIKKYNL